MLLLLACTPPADPPAPEATRVNGTVRPEWSVDALGEIFADPANFPDVGPQELRDTYFGLMSRGDADCPGDPSQLLGLDLRGCTASTGYFYAGVSTWMSNSDGVAGWMLTGDFEIIDPAGHRFIGGGTVNAGPNGDGAGASINGEWSYPGSGAGWLDLGISAYFSETTAADGITLSQGFSYRDLSFWFDALGSDCADGALRGGLRLRDPSGGWYYLEYGDCSACPVVHFEENDAISTDFCPDLTPWLRELQTHVALP